jgi:membrane protease YdiL (CAAX protease family)
MDGERSNPAAAIEAVLLMLVVLPLAVWLSLPTLWFLVPFVVISVAQRSYRAYGLSLDRPGSLRLHASICLIVLGGYCLAHYGYARWWLGRSFHPTVAPDLLQRAVEQVVIIGLSEEFFFRGYMQTQFNRWLGRPYRFLGVQWGTGLIVAAVLFGVCHLVGGDLSRLRTVFFGLFAGWLRERTGTIAVPAVYHGVSNLLYDFMQRSMR